MEESSLKQFWNDFKRAKCISGLRELFSKNDEIVSYNGDYSSFAEAQKFCDGYDSDAIFAKAVSAVTAVINGTAVYERDTFLFHEHATNYNLMMYLQKIFIQDNKLMVCDWGGAFASVFFQHKELLEEMDCQWTVVEQKHFVEYAKEHLERHNLHFCYPSELAKIIPQCNCVLFSSVLQYLDNSDNIIYDICEKSPTYIIVERTPVGNRKRIWVETVHEPIYEASYPCCVFEEKEFVQKFIGCGYKLIDSWHSLVDGDVPVSQNEIVIFKSYVFIKNN